MARITALSWFVNVPSNPSKNLSLKTTGHCCLWLTLTAYLRLLSSLGSSRLILAMMALYQGSRLTRLRNFRTASSNPSSLSCSTSPHSSCTQFGPTDAGSRHKYSCATGLTKHCSHTTLSNGQCPSLMWDWMFSSIQNGRPRIPILSWEKYFSSLFKSS